MHPVITDHKKLILQYNHLLMLDHVVPSEPDIRIIIADHHMLFREGLQKILECHEQFHIIDHAATGFDLLKKVSRHRPDVVITEILLPELSGREATEWINMKFPNVHVIALSQYEEETALLNMLRAGAKGYLLKNSSHDQIVQAVKTVYGNGTYYCTSTSNKLVRLIAENDVKSFQSSKRMVFSTKELEIIRLICHELSSKEIASQLNINCRTVESARERIQEKIGARNMVGIALYAIKNGIFTS